MKRILSLILVLVLICSLLPEHPVFAQQGQKQDGEIPDVTDYSYTITPILSPFTYYLYVKTDNPDPTSFRLVDKSSKFFTEEDRGAIREYTDFGYSYIEVDPGTYYIAQRLYGDVVFEDESSYRVPGGYIFYAHDAYSDGGEFVLLQKTSSGSSLTGDKFKETDVTISCPALHTTQNYLIETCTTGEMDLFEKLDAVQKLLDQITVYPRSVYDISKPSEDYPYPLLAGSPYEELGLNEHYDMFENMDDGILASAAYPFVMDSAAFPSTMWNMAKALEPTCSVSWGGVHWLVDVTFQGKTKSYGGAGEGGNDPLYSDDVQKVFTFRGEDDFGTNGTIEGYRALLRSYEEPAQEAAEEYRDLIAGTTFKQTIRESGGTWIRIGVEGWLGFGTSFGYTVPVGSKTLTLSDAWVDGRYIGTYERVELGATFADHPTADIVLHDVTFTDRNGVTYTQDVCYEYSSKDDRWEAKWFYTGDFWFTTSWELPAELILTREQVESMDLDCNTNTWPTQGLIYDGKEYPGTPFTHKSVTSITIPETLEVYIGKQIEIPTEIEPADVFDDYVAWISSDPEVVEVLSSDSNLIRGLKTGTATLTAVTRDGGYRAVCAVTVLPSPCGNGHTWDEGIVLSEASCYFSGIMLHHCIYCEEEKYEYIPMTEHSYTSTVVAPSCSASGYTRYECDVCGDWYTDAFVDPVGHIWDEGTVLLEPGCEYTGWMLYTCTVCGAETREEIAPAGHQFTVTEVVSPSCLYYGYTVFTCKCGLQYHGNDVAALGHAWNEGVVTTPPTATENGIKTFSCTRCDETKAVILPALGAGEGVCDGGANCPSREFEDVSPAQWYHLGVDFVLNNGLMNGMGSNRFEPQTEMTRAMLVTVLWRYAGSPTGGYNVFTDIEDGLWYSQAVSWASNNNIVTGVGNGKFDPHGVITREQLATILYRYSKTLNLDTNRTADLGSFPDGSTTSYWAEEALSWAVAKGLITGSKEGNVTYLQPQGSATRAQVATILMRFIEHIAE